MDIPRAARGEATRTIPVGRPIIRRLVERNNLGEVFIFVLLQRIPIRVAHCSDADEDRVDDGPD